MSRPLVSCLMPTANRRAHVPLAVATFLRQDYAPRELVIVDDGTDPVADLIPPDPRVRYVRLAGARSLGAKRNQACALARGEVLVHWDDDDWSAPWRLSYQVADLLSTGADLCGLDSVWFYDPVREAAWRYRYSGGRTPWVHGATFCFRRRLWERHAFPDVTVGEDTRWQREAIGARILAHDDDRFFVARVHPGNTDPKETDGSLWSPVPPAQVRVLLGEDRAAFTRGAAPGPLVSCLLPVNGRRAFVSLSLQRYLEQDHARKELVVIDDGEQPVDDLVAGIPAVTYLRLDRRLSLGEKRNLGCAAGAGEIFIHWDDDDWYGSARLSHQIEPIASGRASLTALVTGWMASLLDGRFWSLSPALHRQMFVGDVHGGTLAFSRAVIEDGVRYPDISLADDAAFQSSAVARGHRLARLPNDGLFVYMRHARNTWRFELGRHVDPAEWAPTSPPPALTPGVFAAYRAAARADPALR